MWVTSIKVYYEVLNRAHTPELSRGMMSLHTVHCLEYSIVPFGRKTGKQCHRYANSFDLRVP